MRNWNEIYKKTDEMRMAWAESDAKRDEGITIPDGIDMKCDITYTSSAAEPEKRWHLTDIYYPKDKMEKYPVIISVHGGGWFYGDKELYRLYTSYLASKGFAVVNFNYRRSPQYLYPCGFFDVCCLMDFIIRNADEYEFDMDRLYMVGDSAGAQLVSQYCIFATSEEYRCLFDFSDKLDYVKPSKVALNCGIYAMNDLYDSKDELCEWYIPENISHDLFKSFYNVLDYMKSDFPATYLMLSVNDGLSVHTLPMKKKLEQLGVSVVYREFGEDNEQDGHVFHLNMRSENGRKCNHEEISFFNDEL
ncbi:MAG: alpha/beta hydrolase [Wujia sp.]